jgi:hypothetical protein
MRYVLPVAMLSVAMVCALHATSSAPSDDCCATVESCVGCALCTAVVHADAAVECTEIASFVAPASDRARLEFFVEKPSEPPRV